MSQGVRQANCKSRYENKIRSKSLSTCSVKKKKKESREEKENRRTFNEMDRHEKTFWIQKETIKGGNQDRRAEKKKN